MTILWDTDPTAAESYHFAIGEEAQVVESLPAVTRLLAASPGELLVLVGPDIALQQVWDLATQVRLELPYVGIVLLRRRLDVTVLADALRFGVREVVAAEDLGAIGQACRRSIELSEKLSTATGNGETKQGKVVTVFSAKGGCGKTTVSTNLGAYLASTGAKVLIVDLDLAFGDVAISLQLVPQASMIDVVAMSGNIDEQGLESVVTHHDCGLDAVCAPSEPQDAERIPGATIGELLRVARRSYDFVIVDTPPAFTEHVLAACDVSDLLVLLATLDIPAVKNLRLALDTLDLLGHPREARVVVLNRSDAKVGLRVDDVVMALRQPIGVMIPSSSTVPATINRGVPIVLDQPRHPVSVAIQALAEEHLRPRSAPVRRSSRHGEAADETSAPAQKRRELRFLHRGGRR